MSLYWYHAPLAAVAILASAPVLAQDAERAAIEARYGELRAAMASGDEAAINAIVLPDFVHTDLEGETRDRTALTGMRGPGGRRGPGGPGGPGAPPPPGADGPRPDGPPPADRPRPQVEQTFQSVQIFGNGAAINQTLTMRGSRPGDDGKVHTMAMTMKSSDVWVRQNGVWMLKSSTQKAMSVERDGDVVFSQGE